MNISKHFYTYYFLIFVFGIFLYLGKNRIISNDNWYLGSAFGTLMLARYPILFDNTRTSQ